MKRASHAWIFVSHSTSDLDKVRLVRNAIEAANGEPILFFLKCLSDHDEIDELIKREIEARNFFLLCDSGNAKSSKWVQDEIAHVKSLQTKKIEIIDLDADWQAQIAGIQSIVRQATVFLSYAHTDEAAIVPVREGLIANDFCVWDPSHDLRVGDNFSEQISSAVEESARFGFFIHFLSRASLQSQWAALELDEAIRMGVGNRYVPVLLQPHYEISQLMPDSIHKRQLIDYSDRNVEDIMKQLLRVLGVRNTQRNNQTYG
jgi:TIR domain